ncbi:NAD-dependent epimerase/dehydratase family protein [Nocardioides sp.]|uniref:NAD-dependent epimerase/dehydratase family protein n=1 Tax=Nocardioides sp. TaxID=35761 RepID=UPI0019C0C100|nr:NAD-dependent epimerase/dehydratase family protein [Nocardioides sp.]MBC7277544.1 NAD-dependent epimerase/dehydratase family protein [Nocardioides sp.]
MIGTGDASRPPTLVVGSGGLLGRHVRLSLERSESPVSTVSVPWHDPIAARDVLRSELTSFLGSASASRAGGRVNIAWCAGAGIVATPADELETEVSLFRDVLDDLGAALPPDIRLAFFFASSAGGVYAGSADPPFTEHSEPRPLVAYGRAKLAMEEALTEFCAETGSVALLGRITNLYGPGQALSKPQGLVSQLCLAHLRGTPLPVWVSFDTIRDYLYVGDCAEMVVAALDGLHEHARSSGTNAVVKILATGTGVTLSAVIGETNRIFRRRARLRLPGAGTPSHTRDLRVRSVVWPELGQRSQTPFSVGVRRTADEIALAYAAGTSALPTQVSEISIR